jgi:hypothetical protein
LEEVVVLGLLVVAGAAILEAKDVVLAINKAGAAAARTT